mmetsp:Transcript_5135/g.7817  ORF Transcript_5135/g.7817 Transcript_5135/m.7817 type:complete len:430 (-) Transcript_5135:729-2018(-)|eukprot:CAMPEP_0203749336 /NCGR_PEP_ID=MMETSP0098-20131031/3939_1 /ASSEMBLY_ACC=CAM_ASM_000208 /TAXON_ID=96639 /ORGANISM=" , Strain NY0313808BC1" /LENGTH=429 /DNA_ID=CAMNT_0050638373 /DNA_START=345 /DNA_END=1634 /DNA_ORIENTATION=-
MENGASHEGVKSQEYHDFTYQGKVYHRRKRVPLDPAKKEKLEQAFKAGLVPRGRHGRAAKEKLAKELDLALGAVNKWFDNRRVKDALHNKRMIELVDKGDDPEIKKVATKRRAIEGIVQVGTTASKIPDTGELERTKLPLEHQRSAGKTRREHISFGDKLEQNNFNQGGVDDEVLRAFQVVKHYFNGSDNLWQFLRQEEPNSFQMGLDLDDDNNMMPTRSGHYGVPHIHKRARRKSPLAPTWQNFVDHALTPRDAPLYPLVKAIQIIAGRGAIKALFAKVQTQEQNFRSFVFWYALGKWSGDITLEYFVRSMNKGFADSLNSASIAASIQECFPELIESPNKPHGEGIRKPIFSAEVRSVHFKWQHRFVEDLFIGQKINRGEETNGEILQVIPPSGHQEFPRFKVSYPSDGSPRIISWDDLRPSLQTWP